MSLRARLRPRRERLKGLPFNRMIPNILTLLALCAGMTAIRYGLQGQWERAAIAVLVAAVLDGLDGRVARILKGTSKFGAELDSLSDFICFGVAPALLMYMWAMAEFKRFGWILALLYVVACALRLARFNTDLEKPDLPPWAFNFFTGVPSPAGAGLVLLPMIVSFQFDDDVVRRPEVAAVFVVGVSVLLVSRLPTFSFKKPRVPHRWVLPTMLLVGLLAAGIVAATWTTLALVLIAYLISIPISVRAFADFKKKADAVRHPPPDDGKAIAAEGEGGPAIPPSRPDGRTGIPFMGETDRR